MNNGNLLNRGQGVTNTYDSANRLVAINAISYTFGYNGLGARVKQIVQGAPITYTLDQNAGVPEVLIDTTNTGATSYLYGQVRIAQQTATGTDYFLPDALGSVRQLANAVGALTTAKSYDPYGQSLGSSGSGSSNFSFTGEYVDLSGLLYLRARYYATYGKQFIQPDTFVPQYRDPRTLHRYMYANGNPINHADPSGNRPCDNVDEYGRCITEPGWNKGTQQSAPRLTHDQYIVLITFSESSDGSFPQEAVRRIAWVAWNHVGQADAFGNIDKTWGGTHGQWPTWDETIIHFINPGTVGVAAGYNPNDSSVYAKVHVGLTDNQKRWALSDAYTAYSSGSNYYHTHFVAVEGVVQKISSGQDSDPTGGNIGLYAHWTTNPANYAEQVETNDLTAHAYACPPESIDYRNGQDYYGLVLVTHWFKP